MEQAPDERGFASTSLFYLTFVNVWQSGSDAYGLCVRRMSN